MAATDDGLVSDFDWMLSCTTNFEATVAFVRDVLGLDIRAQGQARVDKHFTRYACAGLPSGQVLEVVEPSEAGMHMNGKQILCFRSDDVHHARHTLEHRDAVIASDMIYDDEGTAWFYVQACDGNLYQIYGPVTKGPSTSASTVSP
jgi:hypothetical protein